MFNIIPLYFAKEFQSEIAPFQLLLGAGIGIVTVIILVKKAIDRRRNAKLQKKKIWPEMNPRSYGKRCKYGHFESDHVNLNKKFYGPNTFLEWDYIHPSPTIDNPKTVRCKGCTCDKFNPEGKGRMFWKWQLNYKVT